MNVWFLPSQAIQARPAHASQSRSGSNRGTMAAGEGVQRTAVPHERVVRAEAMRNVWVVVLGT